MRLLSSFLTILLVPLVAVMPLKAELAAYGAIDSSTQPSGETATAAPTTPVQTNLLKIRLSDDNKPTVEANSFVKGYAIVVTDSSGLPVPDAAVAIRIPEDGPTGFFVNGEHSAVAYTDASGVAKFPQVNWGPTTGSLSVRVTAVKGELHAGVLIEQTVVAAQALKTPVSARVAPFPSAQPPPSQSSVEVPAASIPAAAPTSPSTPNTAAVQAPAKSPVASSRTPGVPTSVAAVHSGAAPEQAPASAEPPASADSVSVVNTAGSQGKSGSAKKWIILAAVVAAAGAGAALALSGRGGAAVATTASPTTTIGAPTVSIGH